MARNARQKARTRLPARKTVRMALLAPRVVLADLVRFLLPFDFS
jgi:hypothetical protein